MDLHILGDPKINQLKVLLKFYFYENIIPIKKRCQSLVSQQLAAAGNNLQYHLLSLVS